MPEPRPLTPRRDDTAADADSLERLGRLDPQPLPAAPSGGLPVETPAPTPPPDPADEQEAVALHAALAEAGVAATADDQAAVQALARLDPATVEAVTRWMRTKKPRLDAPPDRSK